MEIEDIKETLKFLRELMIGENEGRAETASGLYDEYLEMYLNEIE